MTIGFDVPIEDDALDRRCQWTFLPSNERRKVPSSRRQETRWTEAESLEEVNRKRSRNFIPVTSTIGQTTRYRPRECQPALEYRLPQRQINCRVGRTFFYPQRIAMPIDPPFCEKQIVRIIWSVDGRVQVADCLKVSRSHARYLKIHVREFSLTVWQNISSIYFLKWFNKNILFRFLK